MSLLSVKKRNLLNFNRALSLFFQNMRGNAQKKKGYEIRPSFLDLGVFGLNFGKSEKRGVKKRFPTAFTEKMVNYWNS